MEANPPPDHQMTPPQGDKDPGEADLAKFR